MNELSNNSNQDNDLSTDPIVGATTERKFGCLQVTGILLLGMIIAAVITFFVLKKYFFPSEFSPVVLNKKEEQVLDAKLNRLEGFESLKVGNSDESDDEALEPEAYSEEGAKREVEFSEKELNAMLAKNTDLAKKLAVDLSDNLVSAKLLVPVDEDFPVFAGKTIKVRAGMELAFKNERPVVVLKGVSIMGVPIPNAWLGGLKNIDLVEEYGTETDTGFWKSFSEGVEFLQVEEGHLKLKLKE